MQYSAGTFSQAGGHVRETYDLRGGGATQTYSTIQQVQAPQMVDLSRAKVALPARTPMSPLLFVTPLPSHP